MNKMPEFSKKDTSRFWSKIALTANPEKCWEWTEKLDHKGYGRFSYGAHSFFLAPRVSFFIINKQDPFPLNVLHNCDNPKCVNPSHLFLGTQKDNIQDMYNKGRDFKRNGENCGQSKFTNEQILEMRKLNDDGVGRKEICDIFNISKSHLCGIIKRNFWTHI